MKKTRTISLLLSALMLAGNLFACGDTQSDVTTDSTNAPDITDPDSSTGAPDEYVKPDKKFDGQNVNFLLWTEVCHFAAEEESGDTINDAVYARNIKVQDMFGVTFTYDSRKGAGAEYGSWLNTLNSSILAGDNAYQLAGGYGYRLTSDALNDSFRNLQANPYIDFSKPWWPANIIDAANIGGRTNVCFGNLDPSYYDTTYAMFFNKQIAEDIGAGDLYGMVDDGTWTIDKMFSLAINGSRDLDGDTKIKDGDIYGYITDKWMCYDAFIHSCDIKITERDKNGTPVLIGLTERYIDAEKKISEFMNGSGVVRTKGDTNGDLVTFGNGEAFFYPSALGGAHSLRDMSDDFGILPYPKYNEEQERYITYNAIGNSTAFVAPVTADEALAGCIIEALAYYGWKDILPEYYERALKGKATRDSDSEAMLDIIFNNIEYDFTEMYSFNFGDQKAPSMMMRMAVGENKDISSLWAKNETLYKETMESLIETLK